MDKNHAGDKADIKNELEIRKVEAAIKGKKKKKNTEAKMITVIPPVYWMALAGVLIIGIALILWAVFGSISRTLTVTGIYHPGAVKEGEIVTFLPLSTGKMITEGMDVGVNLNGYNLQEYGHMKGKISYVDPYVTGTDTMLEILGDESLVQMFSKNGPVVAVVCKLEEDKNAENGYYWSNERGGSVKLKDGTYAAMTVTLERVRPITLGIPKLKEIIDQ